MIVKVGVIGIGTVSQLMHLPILSGLHEQYQITAVSDISPTQLAFIAKKYNATPYTDPYELVKDPNVDAVFVCSPTSTMPHMPWPLWRPGNMCLWKNLLPSAWRIWKS